MDTINKLNETRTQLIDQLNQVRNLYATILYYNKSESPSKITFGESEDGSLYTEVDSYKCRLLRGADEIYYGTARNLLLISLISIFEEYCNKLFDIANEYRIKNNKDVISKNKIKNYFRCSMLERWQGIFEAFNVDFSTIPKTHQRDLELLDLYRCFRNQIVHDNGTIDQKFKDKVCAICNNPKRRHQLDNSDQFYISSFDFSEGIYLFELTTSCMITSIIKEIKE